MTLMKSALLASATTIIAVASAQAADLPSKKAAPVSYVKVCDAYAIEEIAQWYVLANCMQKPAPAPVVSAPSFHTITPPMPVPVPLTLTALRALEHPVSP